LPLDNARVRMKLVQAVRSFFFARAVIILVKVRKRMEEFDKAKLELSMEKAGAKEADARKVADKIAGKVKEGTSTAKIWEWVIQELKPLDPKAAKAYRTYRTRIARAPERLTSASFLIFKCLFFWVFLVYWVG